MEYESFNFVIHAYAVLCSLQPCPVQGNVYFTQKSCLIKIERQNVGRTFPPLEPSVQVCVMDRRGSVLRNDVYENDALMMDNLHIHTSVSLYEAFNPQEARPLIKRPKMLYTPKHGSWLNIAEIELDVLRHQCLRRRIADRPVLVRETAA